MLYWHAVYKLRYQFVSCFIAFTLYNYHASVCMHLHTRAVPQMYSIHVVANPALWYKLEVVFNTSAHVFCVFVIAVHSKLLAAE